MASDSRRSARLTAAGERGAVPARLGSGVGHHDLTRTGELVLGQIDLPDGQDLLKILARRNRGLPADGAGKSSMVAKAST